jgi:hypothetical protein
VRSSTREKHPPTKVHKSRLLACAANPCNPCAAVKKAACGASNPCAARNPCAATNPCAAAKQ